MENIIIPSQENLEKIKRAIALDGPSKLHVLADFDKTLTTAFVAGKPVPSIISVLRDNNYLTPDYPEKAKALYAKYHTIEIDPNVPEEEKRSAMREWWETHFKLLIESGLEYKDIESVVASGKIKLRPGADDLINFLYEKNISLVILSSSGLGEAISLYLKKENLLSENVIIISNSFEWDEAGKALKIKEPVIHGMNKEEAAIKNYPQYENLKDKKNIILLGDSPHDLSMVKGLTYDNLLKIGFLNEEIEKNLDEFKKSFDVVILNDSPMDYLNKVLREIIK